jgi:hypothetical protein
MNKNKRLKIVIIIPILVIILLWVGIVVTDYIRLVRIQAPIFAQKINASDADIYRGIGYTIIIYDGYAIAPSDAELKGYFYWGRR